MVNTRFTISSKRKKPATKTSMVPASGIGAMSTKFGVRRRLRVVVPARIDKNGMGETFSADQVVGKSLTAKKDIPVLSRGYDNSPVIGVVKAGQPIGIVTSFLSPAAGRSSLYWEMNSNGKIVYVKHEIGAFDVGNLKVQGSITTEQKFEEQKSEEQKKNDPILYYFKKIGIPVVLTGAGIYAAVEIAKAFIQKPKS